MGTSINSFLINLEWKVDRVSKVFPLHSVRPQSVPGVSLQGFPAPLEETWLEVPLCQPAVEEHQGAKSTGGGIKREEKSYGVVWGTMVWIQGKRRRKTYQGENKVSGTHPALLMGTENAGKLIAKCGCVKARFSCPDLTTKCSHGNAAISQFVRQVPLMFPSL